jgi:dedicator of cytokinesis protein 3
MLFKNVSLTRKLGFPDVIMPGDVRNDLYVTLDKGEFERGGKSTGKNIEVTVTVLDQSGAPLEVSKPIKMHHQWDNPIDQMR